MNAQTAQSAPTPSQSAMISNYVAANATAVNDMTRLLGYSGGTPMMTMQPRASSLPYNPIQGGTLLVFTPQIEIIVGQFDTFKMVWPRVRTTVSPQRFQKVVRRKFHENDDNGYRDLDCLAALPYEIVDGQIKDEAFTYFDVVHPAISCSYGLESMHVSRTEGNVGATHWQACPTCRLADLRSDACSERIYKASAALDSQILSALREKLIEACQSTIEFAHRKIEQINSDLEKRSNHEHGRSYRNETDYIYLRMVHQEAPTKANPVTDGEAIATAVATAIAPYLGKQESPVAEVVSDPLMAEFLEFKRMKEAGNIPAVSIPVNAQVPAVTETVAKCGETGGVTASGEACKNTATLNGRCQRHPREEVVSESENNEVNVDVNTNPYSSGDGS